MKTGTGRPCRHPVVLAAIFAGTLVFPLLLSGCDDHSPVAAPTSTLPAKDSSADPSGDQSTPSVPEYKTDLDLSAEEKKAVEGALVALDGYVETLNRAFSSGGKQSEKLDEFAKGDALVALKDDSESLNEKHQYMAGEFKLQSRKINSVNASASQVAVLSCVNNAAFAQVDQGQDLPDSKPQQLTVEFVAVIEDKDWKVESQDLWSEQCED